MPQRLIFFTVTSATLQNSDVVV